MDSIVHQFCAEQRELLKFELLQSESSNHLPSSSASETQSQQQSVLHALHVHDLSVGLYGRTLVQLKRTETQLPAHRFTTGDEVEIQSRRSGKSTGGVIHQVTDELISVALFSTTSNNKNSRKEADNNSKKDEEDDFVGTPPLSLLPKSSVEVHKKLLMALDELEEHGSDHPVAGTVIQTVFCGRGESLYATSNATATATSHSASTAFQSTHLDNSQTEAVQMALRQPVALLHGPPGSGKTTTVVELIRQAVLVHKYRVLVTAPSNVAIDNILSRLVALRTSHHHHNKKHQLHLVRLGHPARLQADILPYSLEALVQAAEGTEIVQDVRKELQTWLRRVNHPRTKYADKATARREMKLLRQEIKQREQKVVQDLLQRAQVVLATCVGAASRLLSSKNGDSKPFDLVIIDEAAQSLEAACWIPILRGSRLVLAGDHCQLPPTIQCNDPRVQQKLGHTMFARIMKLYAENPNQISRMLKVQYRMHETIANWASEALYHGELTTHESAQGRTLATLSGVSSEDDDEDLVRMPLLLIDTAGCDCHESTNAAGSRFNPGEAQIVQHHVQKLLDIGVPASQIAVITPYNGQVEQLKSMGMPVEIRTVDGFQGGEREAVVLSLVRSSPRKGGSIGFLRDDRRLNVAVTRAKRHCCVVADSETVSSSPFVKNLIEWIEQHGEQRSALDYITMDDTHAQLDRDLMQAQLVLQTFKTKATDNGPTTKKDKGTSSVEREALLERVRKFHRTGKPGDELILSKDISKGDRRAVHELAEELDVLHISSGTEGMDRRMTLSIPRAEPSSNSDLNTTTTIIIIDNRNNQDTGMVDDVDETDSHEVGVSPIPAFHVLQPGEDESSSSASEEEEPSSGLETRQSFTNPLAFLAKEREQREKDRKAQQSDSAAATGTKTSKKKKKTGQKVGVCSRPRPRNDEKKDKMDEHNIIEDDMAFLDAQIHKVQNSHGRTVTGKGPNYRTIINGILLATPTPVAKKADPRATSALQAKLKQAENSRKAKSKPKKK